MQQASKEPADSTMRFCLCDENIEINEDFPDKIWVMAWVYLILGGWGHQMV